MGSSQEELVPIAHSHGKVGVAASFPPVPCPMGKCFLQGSFAKTPQDPLFAFVVLHKHSPASCPTGDKVCPWGRAEREVSTAAQAAFPQSL